MSKETSAEVAKLAAYAMKKPGMLSHTEVKTLAASALTQREPELVWPTWRQLGYKRSSLLYRRWHINSVAYMDIRAVARRVAKRLAK
jgi:hypothetical protein